MTDKKMFLVWGSGLGLIFWIFLWKTVAALFSVYGVWTLACGLLVLLLWMFAIPYLAGLGKEVKTIDHNAVE